MSANKKSSLMLLGLFLAVASLLGVFAIMDASTANASPGEIPQTATVIEPRIVISPLTLQATLHPGEVVTQTLWITNTGDTELSFTIDEITAALRAAAPSMLPAAVPLLEPELQSQIAADGTGLAIIFLREQPDVSAAYQIRDNDARGQYVYNRLRETASHSQELFQWLKSQGTDPQRLLIANAIAATLNNSQLAVLAANQQVRQISLNHQYSITPGNAPSQIGPPLAISPLLHPDTVEWNIAKIRADEAWSAFGITGEGAVAGIIDTGVEYDHPALVNSYRGNLGGGNFDHNYNWFDFVNHQPVPYDDLGHGTFGTGIITGSDGGENQIGVAPGAAWIATKACDAGFACDEFALISALEWMLAPTDLSGANPDPTKAPNIVLGMWGGGTCDHTFETILDILQAANILPVFVPGAGGPSCNSMSSPGDLSVTVAAGATDQNDLIASFSGRGPGCDGVLKPDVTAPGVIIRSSTIVDSYAIESGTSFSSAHLAGTAALLFSAKPDISIEQLRQILFSTALCIDSQECTPGATCPDPNNTYGHGRIDAYQAVYAALGYPPNIDLPWLREAPLSATLQAGEAMPISITFDSTGIGAGSYNGGLGIISDDPIEPFISVPVTMSVTEQAVPIIAIDPISLSATLAPDGVQIETLTISNDGSDVLTFNLHEISTTLKLIAPAVQLSVPGIPPSNSHDQVDPGVQSQLLFKNKSRLIIYLRGGADLAEVNRITDRPTRAQYVYDQLLKLATQSDELNNWLISQDAQPHRLLLANAIAATLDESQLETVLSYPQVAWVGVNGEAQILQNDPATQQWLQGWTQSPDNVEWNIAKIRANEVWSTFGIRGQGAVVGIVDTGVMLNHPALNAQYRGNLGDGSYENNYNWFDLVNDQPAPYDDNGHGTFGMGIAVGDDGAENQIGVAPEAKWIAVKALNAGGGATFEQLQAALEWMLVPTDLNGENPDPAKAPNVVLNMWGFPGCEHTFDASLAVLRVANILPVFAPGGGGPECGTIASPAANPDALSAGATDINDIIAENSPTGPSCYDGSIKPDVAAPGVNIRSSAINGGYDVWTGTSFSTAHLAGAAALLFSAKPDISVDQLEQTLFDTAVCRVVNNFCGGEACPGPNNTYGHGRIDVYQAVATLIGQAFDLPWLDETPTSGSALPGESVSITVTFNAAGLQPGTYTGGISIQSNDPMAPLTTVPVTMTITAPCEPLADLTAIYIPQDPAVGEVITFTASASGSLPISFAWDFADGNPLYGTPVTYVFDTPGPHFVGLTAKNACDLETVDYAVPVEAIIQRILLPLVGK